MSVRVRDHATALAVVKTARQCQTSMLLLLDDRYPTRCLSQDNATVTTTGADVFLQGSPILPTTPYP